MASGSNRKDQPKPPERASTKRASKADRRGRAPADAPPFRRLRERLRLLQSRYTESRATGSASDAEALAEKLPLREQRFSTGGSATKLFVIRARGAPNAVIFRRGPSKQVQLIRWRTDDDSFEPGQWFKGRIYERRCDLSPDGRYLVYFAAKFGGPLYSWTAVSKSPYLTALALWRKGDCWEGGGLFETSRSLWLNHPSGAEPMAGFRAPGHLTVWSNSWGGEDSPIYDLRLLRDGWGLAQPGKTARLSRKQTKQIGLSFPFESPRVWERASGSGAILRMIVHGVGERGGDWYVVTHEIVTTHGKTLSLGRTDWADWDRNGDLLFARDGKLFRLSIGPGGAFDPAQSREIADFADHRFQAVPPPDEAKRW